MCIKNNVQLKVLFLKHQILYDPWMACCDVSSSSLQNSGQCSLRISRSLWKPGMFERPLDLISIRVDVYPAFRISARTGQKHGTDWKTD